MTTFFVDSRNGNDSNSGLTAALAFKTLGGFKSAVPSGSIAECSGVFNESYFHVNKTLTFNAKDFAIMDGQGVLVDGLNSLNSNARSTFNGFHVRNYIGAGVKITGQTRTTFNDCLIENCLNGLFLSGIPLSMNFTRVTIRSCSAFGLTLNPASGFESVLLNCTITDCGTGIRWNSIGAGDKLSIKNCILSHNTVRHINVVTANALAKLNISDFNDIDFGSGTTEIAGSPQTSLAAWQTASGKDPSSISLDPQYVDRLKRLHKLLSTSPCLVNGSLAFGSLIQGAENDLQADGFSTNRDAAVWNGAVLSNVVLDGSNNYVLASGSTVGTVTFLKDFGVLRNISKMTLKQLFSNPTSILDFDKTDTLPETWQFRIRTSVDATPPAGAFTTVAVDTARGVDLNLVGIQQIEVEVTLRKDA